MSQRPNCRGTTKLGKPCANKASSGSAYCGAHGGGARPVGIPTKLNELTLEAILATVKLGAPYRTAAQAAGVHEATFRAWRAQGELDLEAGHDTIFARLSAQLPCAQAEGEAALVDLIRAHAAVDWRAGAWILERRRPVDYARRDHVEHSGTVNTGEPVTVDPEQAAADVAAVLAEAGAITAAETNQ